MLKVSEQPCLLLVDDFLSPSECQAVRCLGGPHLKRSMVSAGGWRQGGERQEGIKKQKRGREGRVAVREGVGGWAGKSTGTGAWVWTGETRGNKGLQELLLDVSASAPVLALASTSPPSCRDPSVPACLPASPPSVSLPLPEGDETPLRTSSGAFLTGSLAQHPVAAHLDLRVSQLAALACQVEGRRPLQLGEATQVVRYDPGQVRRTACDGQLHCSAHARGCAGGGEASLL